MPLRHEILSTLEDLTKAVRAASDRELVNDRWFHLVLIDKINALSDGPDTDLAEEYLASAPTNLETVKCPDCRHALETLGEAG